MLRHIYGNREQPGTAHATVWRRRGVLPAANEALSTLHVDVAYFLVVGVFGFDLVVPLGAGISFLPRPGSVSCAVVLREHGAETLNKTNVVVPTGFEPVFEP